MQNVQQNKVSQTCDQIDLMSSSLSSQSGSFALAFQESFMVNDKEVGLKKYGLEIKISRGDPKRFQRVS